jgi:hypothetical protein
MSDFRISLEQAITYITSWRSSASQNSAKAHLIAKEALLDVMAPSDVVSVRAYLGKDENGAEKLIFVGVDANGKDLMDENHFLTDRSSPCPPNCDVDESPLLILR